MKKYTKKDRVTLEDPKSEITKKKSKHRKKKYKPYHIVSRYTGKTVFKWLGESREWRINSSFAKKTDRDREFRRTVRKWEGWDFIEFSVRDDNEEHETGKKTLVDKQEETE